jgi:predicted nucleic acid-binding Zn ribbon protein
VVEGTEYCERHTPPDAPCIVCGAALSTPQQLAQGKCGLADQAHAVRWSKLSPGYTP